MTHVQSPPFDWILQWFSRLGEPGFLFIVVTIFSLWLGWQQNWISVSYLLSALLVPLGIIVALSWTQSLPESLTAKQSLSSFNIPSGHTALAISTYGFIAIIFSRQFSIRIRLSIYIGIAWLVSIIGFTRIYFTTHLLTDVIAGFLLGLAWLCIIAIAYRRHNRDASIRINKTALSGMLFILLTASFPYTPEYKVYSEPTFEQYYVLSDKAWLESGWQSLPTFRQDLKSKNQYPFNLQWVGKHENLVSVLLEQGWQQSETETLKFAQWFNPLTTVEQLPLLPHVHDGRYDDVRLYKVSADKEKLLVLRLWKSDTLVKTQRAKQPLWIGNVSLVKKRNIFPLSYLYTSTEFNQSSSDFIHLALQAGFNLTETTRELDNVLSPLQWDGRVLLLSR